VVRRELADILSQPDYNRAYGPSPVDQAWQWVLEMILRLAGWLGRLFGIGAGTAGRIASIVFACLVVLAFLAIVAVVIRRLAGRAQPAADSVADSAPYQLPSAAPLVKQAQRLADEGDYRAAFRCAYLASISHLDEVGALRFERSRTNWEYIRELAGRGHVRATDTLGPLTLDFDRKFYGREPCTAEDYHNALGAYRRVAGEVSA
jgi:hypothetical protein